MEIEHQTVEVFFFVGGGAGAGRVIGWVWVWLGRDVDFLKGGWKGVFVCI